MARFGKRLTFAIFVGGALLVTAPARADFPDHPVKIIIAFPPGSALDALTRFMGNELSAVWREPVIVENVEGGSGNVGTERFARAEPDGYTLLSSPPGPMTFNKLVFRDIHYDATAFVPISLMAKLPNVLLVRKDFEAANLRDFIRLAVANPGKYNYASQGVTSTGFLTTQLFEARTGAKMVHVPYRGANLALSDIAAGHVDMMFDVIMTSLPQHRGGAARIIGVADAERLPALPEVPTFAESGLPGFTSSSAFTLAAPAGAPVAIADKINRDVAAIIQRPDIAERLRGMMYTPVGATRPETAQFLREETATWSKLIQDLHLEPQ